MRSERLQARPRQRRLEATLKSGAIREVANKELIMTAGQPGLEVSAPSTYREKLFNLLANRDPIEVLGQTASTLAGIVARHPAEVLRGRAIQEKWTPNEIIGHLTDSEWIYGYRFRLILCEDEPAILGYRQDVWVDSLRHNEREPSELVEIFQTLRLLNLSVWRRLSPVDLQRSGQHNERGEESLAVMLQLLAGHDLSHLHQIRRYMQALEAWEAASASASGSRRPFSSTTLRG
jgi:hypothetical protein